MGGGGGNTFRGRGKMGGREEIRVAMCMEVEMTFVHYRGKQEKGEGESFEERWGHINN